MTDGVSHLYPAPVQLLAAFLADSIAFDADDRMTVHNAAYCWLPVERLEQPAAVNLVIVFAGEQDGPERLDLTAWVAGQDQQPRGNRFVVDGGIPRPTAFAPRDGQPLMWQMLIAVGFTPTEPGRHTVVLCEGDSPPIATVPFAVTLA